MVYKFPVMTMYKSFIHPIGTPLCQHLFMQNLCKNEVVSLKVIKYTCNEKSFSTSMVKKTRWPFKFSKSKKGFSSPTKLIDEELGNVEVKPFSINLLVKPFFFTLAFSSASIAATAIWQYENIANKTLLLMKKSWMSDTFFKYKKKKFGWREEINKYWSRLSEGEKLFVPICFLNVMVFLAWKVQRFQTVMVKYFCSSPFGEAVCWPMVLTVFSHYNFVHLAANMYVLHSFSTVGVEALGKEQFLGLYLAAGAVSSFTSYLFKALKSQHTLSLGASGAIMAMVAYICTQYPDTKLSIILLPWIVFSAGTGIKAIMALDVLGVIRGWAYLDHAAHLGGALCGVGWCYWGNTYIWKKREPLLHWWHEIRTSAK